MLCILGLQRGFQCVIERAFVDTIHRIYKSAPYFAVAQSALGMLIIYPVDVGDSFHVTMSALLGCHTLLFSFHFGPIGSYVKFHLAAHGHSAASLALRAAFRDIECTVICIYLSRALALPAERYFGRS